MHVYPLREFRQRKDQTKLQKSFREQSFPLLDSRINKKVRDRAGIRLGRTRVEGWWAFRCCAGDCTTPQVNCTAT